MLAKCKETEQSFSRYVVHTYIFREYVVRWEDRDRGAVERVAKKIIMMVLSVSHWMKDTSAPISMGLMTVRVKTGVSCILRLDNHNESY